MFLTNDQILPLYPENQKKFLGQQILLLPCKSVTLFESLACWVKILADDILKLFSYFSQEQDLTFHASCLQSGGWLGVVKVSCILHYRGVQLILAYIWARLAILRLVAGKGRGECFYSFCFFPFIPVPLSSLFLFLTYPSLSSPLLSFPSLYSLSFGNDTK